MTKTQAPRVTTILKRLDKRLAEPHATGARRNGKPREAAGKPVYRAIERIGGEAEVARRLGITQPAVHGWVVRNRCPAERVAWLSEASGLKRSELRPDLYRRGE